MTQEKDFNDICIGQTEGIKWEMIGFKSFEGHMFTYTWVYC